MATRPARWLDGVWVYYRGDHFAAGYYNEDGLLVGITVLSPCGYIMLYYIPNSSGALRNKKLSDMEQVREHLTETKVDPYIDHPGIRLIRDFSLSEVPHNVH